MSNLKLEHPAADQIPDEIRVGGKKNPSSKSMENSFTLIKHVQARDISLEAATDVNLVGRCFEENRTSAVMLTWPRWRFENKHSIWTEARDMRLETSHRFYQMWGELSISSSHLPVSECCLQYDYVLVSGLIGCKKKRQITIFQLWNMDFLLICIHVCISCAFIV